MKKIVLLLTLCCALIACKKIEVNFSYSPTAPRAGESVQFSNLSSSGEDWEWQFGDGLSSTLKSPSHAYKKPGTYLVVLTVDKKSSFRASKEITVHDTLPTFVCKDSLFTIFTDYTFTANFYNPYNYEHTFEWAVNDSVMGTEASLTTFFVDPDDSVSVSLHLTMATLDTVITKRFFVEDRATNSVLLRTPEGDFRQRIFGKRAEEAELDVTASDLLDLEQDTAQFYNGYEFLLSELQKTFPALEGFHIASRKIYYRAEGLWVANIDGAYPVQIDSLPCTAMTLDVLDSRIYWANEKGVWYMPFVGSDNNKFVSIPVQLNTFDDVTKLAADGEAK